MGVEVIKYLIKMFLIFYSAVIFSVKSNQPTCEEQCDSHFGKVNGQSFLTTAYSNCSSYCVSKQDNFVELKGNQKIFSGMKWQCVEYARRWLIENKHKTFSDVEYAYHIWNLKYAEDIDTKKKVPLLKFKNRHSTTRPQIGDLLIYSNKLAVTGHVAVIVGIDNNSVTIAEQNYFNRAWEGKDYARRLLLDVTNKNCYRIIDEAVIGWVRVAA